MVCVLLGGGEGGPRDGQCNDDTSAIETGLVLNWVNMVTPFKSLSVAFVAQHLFFSVCLLLLLGGCVCRRGGGGPIRSRPSAYDSYDRHSEYPDHR